MDVMANEVDPFLGLHYHEFYLETTAQSHANMFGLERRLVAKDGGGYSYKETSDDEARFALYLGHNLMIRLLAMQNEYFRLGLDEPLKECVNGFATAWVSDAPKTPDAAPASQDR
jgi:hypothetical protein